MCCVDIITNATNLERPWQLTLIQSSKFSAIKSVSPLRQLCLCWTPCVRTGLFICMQGRSARWSHDIQYQHHIRCHKLLGEVMVIIMFCVCSNIYIDMLSRKKCMCNRMKRICTFELYIILPFRLLLPFTYNINCVSVFGNIGND